MEFISSCEPFVGPISDPIRLGGPSQSRCRHVDGAVGGGTFSVSVTPPLLDESFETNETGTPTRCGPQGIYRVTKSFTLGTSSL